MQLQLLRPRLENETVTRIEMENQLKTLKEDLQFVNREHENVCCKY